MTSQRLFPTGLPPTKWFDFEAAGFVVPATGVVYRENQPATNGIPLGGLDTGCLDLETTGLLGYLTIFNSLAPRRGPINEPFMGVKVDGQSHVLATVGMPGVQAARRVHYWGHHPVADIEFELDSPLSVELRSWSLFAPGDVDASMIPGAVFEFHLRNQADRPLTGTLGMSFPGFETHAAGYTHGQRARGDLSGGRRDRAAQRSGVRSRALGERCRGRL